MLAHRSEEREAIGLWGPWGNEACVAVRDVIFSFFPLSLSAFPFIKLGFGKISCFITWGGGSRSHGMV